jgi:hypothetical protein
MKQYAVPSIPVLILKGTDDLQTEPGGNIKHPKYNENAAAVKGQDKKVPDLPFHKEPETSYNSKGKISYRVL